MIKVEYETGEKIAADLASTHRSIDDALANVAHLTAAVVDACRHSTISAAKSQATMQEISDGFSGLVIARKSVVGAHRQINKVQRNSNLEAVDFGCEDPPIPGASPFTGDGHLKVVSN